MNLLMALYVAVLFFVLTPGVVLSLPADGSLNVVAATHAVVFAIVYALTARPVWNAISRQ